MEKDKARINPPGIRLALDVQSELIVSIIDKEVSIDVNVCVVSCLLKKAGSSSILLVMNT